MKINNFEPSVGREAINLFERFLEGKLSKEYREFLLQYNGGKPDPCDFDLADDSSCIQEFYKLNSVNNWDDLLEIYRTFKGRIPKTLLSIACDPGGNQICLAISGRDFGKVFFWDHEKENLSNAEADQLEKIADSFSDFLNCLYEDEY